MFLPAHACFTLRLASIGASLVNGGPDGALAMAKHMHTVTWVRADLLQQHIWWLHAATGPCR